MTQGTIQNSFVGGEISPQLFGRTDLGKWHNGCSTLRNFFPNYRGGASSRPGGKYVGTSLQSIGLNSQNPPRIIKFQFNINQGYVLEFGDQTLTPPVTGAADNGSGIVRLAVVSTQGIFSGSTMIVSSVVGTTEANGTWIVTVIDSTHVDLIGSSFVNAYVSGGTTADTSGYMRIISNGSYVIEATKTITGATNANPCVLHIASHGYSVGDWIFIQSMGGMTNFNGLFWIVNTVPDSNHVTVTDLFGNTINSSLFSAYTSGGTSARLYTVASPYLSADLQFLKYTQSADTMSFACVNQESSTDYPPYDLVRNGATNWVFTQVTFASSIAAPAGLSATAHSSTTPDTWYSYVVTAVDAMTGEESIASSAAAIENNDISINAGSNSLSWSSVSGASSYNVYAATPQYSTAVPSGVLYGFLGSSIGTNFVDTNIVADFTTVPPVHNDPFPSTGNYPGVVAYYQQRRFYGNTLNNPDTYWASQPGAYLNMDSSIPTSDSDAIVGAPWAQQVNGIQFMQPMTGGLIILTGSGAWNLTGGSNAAITPSDQTATAQAYNGCHFHIQPIVVNYDILYVQAKGSIVRDLSYNFFVNIYTGTDMTVLSNHLFAYHQLQAWDYAEEPYKIIWAIRDDGIMLSLTYLKEQDVYSWARHDTNGFYVGVCTVTEPPVDAVYTVTQRYIIGQNKWMYYIERLDNRNWTNSEDCFCVDAGLAYPMIYPNATLTPISAVGTNNITSTLVITGGANYTSPTVTAVDSTGQGSGATFSATVVSGVITAITPLSGGTKYTPGLTNLVIIDATGFGAVVQPIITDDVIFTASSSVFNSGMVGNVIRIGNNNAGTGGFGVTTSGGGKAIVTSYTSVTQITANIIEPITATIPNDPNYRPVPLVSGQWSISVPTSTVSGLNHLEGMSVAIVADGGVLPNQIVTNGTVTLPQAASAITVGLPYTCQLQTLYLEPAGQPTVQGKRKNIYNVSVRMQDSRGIAIGTNQPDQSAQTNNANVPWTNLKQIKEGNALINAGSAIPLFTGDYFMTVPASWDEYGQVAIQQSYPMPADILSVVSFYKIGDTSDR